MENTLNISEYFLSLQGEGIYTGVPSVFLRLNYCNLVCCFRDSVCDTPYTSHNPEANIKMTTEEVVDKVIELFNKTKMPYDCHLVITGGEPMLQQQAIVDFIFKLRDKGYYNKITIETNGTITPIYYLEEAVFWSVSPKLITSCCFEGKKISDANQEYHKKHRINIRALSEYVKHKHQLKFVYSGEESVDEIKRIIDDIIKNLKSEYYQINQKDINVLLMPEGITNNQISEHSQKCAEICIENGWRYCDRLHIRIWGDKRGV